LIEKPYTERICFDMVRRVSAKIKSNTNKKPVHVRDKLRYWLDDDSFYNPESVRKPDVFFLEPEPSHG